MIHSSGTSQGQLCIGDMLKTLFFYMIDYDLMMQSQTFLFFQNRNEETGWISSGTLSFFQNSIGLICSFLSSMSVNQKRLNLIFCLFLNQLGERDERIS
jgi:hypothetical protein